MSLSIQPLQVNSLTGACITRLEELVLSGELRPGERLPAERDLAARLGVSRPVLHEALVDLAAKGLVTILPRRGVIVNDYRKSGSTAILSSLLSFHQGSLDTHFVLSLFEMRFLVETETARLAALRASQEEIDVLHSLLAAEDKVDRDDIQALTDLDFEFHLQISLASANLVYPLILNSFKNVYIHFTEPFFKQARQTGQIEVVFEFHRRLVEAIAAQQPQQAAEIMSAMLIHGEEPFKGGTL